jgi:hypothetical protein
MFYLSAIFCDVMNTAFEGWIIFCDRSNGNTLNNTFLGPMKAVVLCRQGIYTLSVKQAYCGLF